MKKAAIFFAGGIVLVVALIFGGGGGASIVENATDVVTANADRSDEGISEDDGQQTSRPAQGQEPTFADMQEPTFADMQEPDFFDENDVESPEGEPAAPAVSRNSGSANSANRPSPLVGEQSGTRPRTTRPRQQGNGQDKLAEDIRSALSRN